MSPKDFYDRVELLSTHTARRLLNEGKNVCIERHLPVRFYLQARPEFDPPSALLKRAEEQRMSPQEREYMILDERRMYEEPMHIEITVEVGPGVISAQLGLGQWLERFSDWGQVLHALSIGRGDFCFQDDDDPNTHVAIRLTPFPDEQTFNEAHVRQTFAHYRPSTNAPPYTHTPPEEEDEFDQWK